MVSPQSVDARAGLLAALAVGRLIVRVVVSVVFSEVLEFLVIQYFLANDFQLCVPCICIYIYIFRVSLIRFRNYRVLVLVRKCMSGLAL